MVERAKSPRTPREEYALRQQVLQMALTAYATKRTDIPNVTKALLAVEDAAMQCPNLDAEQVYGRLLVAINSAYTTAKRTYNTTDQEEIKKKSEEYNDKLAQIKEVKKNGGEQCMRKIGNTPFTIY